MPTVSIICTVHKEIGTANAGWLHELLVQLAPDVIFLEVSRPDFGDFYETRRRISTESIAVNRFCENRSVSLEPVDLDARTRDLCESEDAMMMRIWDESRAFRDLLKVDTQRVEKHGFYYLNSDLNDAHWKEVEVEMQASIERIGDLSLKEFFDEWRRSNNKREEVMLRKIGDYCASTQFNAGAFLIGSAHRPTVLQKIVQIGTAPKSFVSWEIPMCFKTQNTDRDT